MATYKKIITLWARQSGHILQKNIGYTLENLGCNNLDMYDDPKINIGWLKCSKNTTSIMHQASMKETKDKIALFHGISITQIFRELNSEVEQLVKDAVQLDPGVLQFEHIVEGISTTHLDFFSDYMDGEV
jgi:hypothetical protein